MELNGKKIVVLVEQLYEDLELWYPVLRFREAGATVNIVGPKKGSYPSKHGYEAEADLAADKVKAKDIDALIIPGGYAPDHMRRHEAMVGLVQEAAEKGKVVAAICHAGWMLCSAGVVKGKKATCYFSIKDDLVNAGAEYLDQEVVRDGNLITSRFPADLPAFCRMIIEALQ
ncbi:MAG: type 1 glutamine amidotransferase [Desulfuromonadales bacterium]|jgi:protease I